jgi:hypothetical protein
MLPALSRLMTLTSPLAPRSYQPPNLMNVLIVDTRQSHITRARLLWDPQCFSAQRESQRPPRRRSFVPQRSPPLPDPEPLTGSAPRSLTGRYQVPGIIPGDDRPAIRRTMLDDLTGPPKKSPNGGSVRERRYHRTTQVRMHVCKYGEYECTEILPWSERVFGLGETALFLTGHRFLAHGRRERTRRAALADFRRSSRNSETRSTTAASTAAFRRMDADPSAA